MRDRFKPCHLCRKARDLRKRVVLILCIEVGCRSETAPCWMRFGILKPTVQSEAESILLEGKLIKEYRRVTMFLRDDKRFLLVKVID